MKNLKIKETFVNSCIKISEAHNVVKPGNYHTYKIIEITDIPNKIPLKEVISKYNTTVIANNIYCVDFKSLGSNKIVTH